MNKKFLAIALSVCLCNPAGAVDDFAWNTPSVNCSGSMPLGGGDIGMNVWVDFSSNDVQCLVCQSGSFDENNTLLKFGQLRIQLDDPREKFVEQRLCLEKGSMLLTFENTIIELWVDVWKPVIHVEANRPVDLKFETWRDQPRRINRFVCQQSSWKWALPKNVKTYTLPDSIQQHEDGTVIVWHQNQHDNVLQGTLELEHMGQYVDSIYNPIRNRITGGQTIRLNGRPTKNPQETYDQWAIVLCNQQSSLSEWQKQLQQTTLAINSKADKRATQKWWKEFWERSFIISDGKAHEALRNYNLFRYMMGCNAHPAKEGERWPTKYNGGLFTFSPVYCDTILAEYDKESPDIVTPDYRRWGGGTHTAQNQRLVYWPLLQTGDFDALQGELDFYSRILPAAELRSRHYWGHGGACFTEQIENFGMPNIAEYGKHRNGGDPGIEDNRWLEYEWDTALEFAEMYCLYPHAFSPYGAKASAQAAHRLIMSCLRFFDEHYTELDSLGHKIIYPGSACETYKLTRNAASTIAGLLRVSGDAIEHQAELALSADEVAWLHRFRDQLPPIPTCQHNGKTLIAAAESWERMQNVETPQLYPVWPWRIIGGQLASDTYHNDSIALHHRNWLGWKQDNIWAAYVGDTDEAWRLTMNKLLVQKAEHNCDLYRFPAFWGPGYDWMPDHNWGGSAMIGLHAMLMQEDERGRIRLLPAWPKDQDVHFRLWASGHRQVEVDYRGGKIVRYTINGKSQL